jgi:hypothetical protein
MLKKVIVYYTRKHKNILKKIGYDLIIIIFKDKTLNLQRITTFSKIHIYFKMTKKKM